MAQKEVQKGMRDLEKEITCAICHRHYREPKVLPCCHYYCKQCIQNLAQKTGSRKPFSCPECRADTTLPQGGVKELPAAFFVNRMKEIHSKLELAHGKVEAKCEICSIDKVEAFCRQCAQFICSECVKSHQRMKKAFPGHVITTLDDLKKGGAKDIVVPEPSLQICQLHEQPMNVYCFDCKSLICLYCSIKTHSNHNHESVKVAVSDTKKKLLEKLNDLGKTKDSLSMALKLVKTTKANVTAQGKSEAKKIENSFAELSRVIEKRKMELLAESKRNMNKKLESLSGQVKTLSTKCSVVQSVIDYTKQCIEHSSDDEVMSKHTEIQSRIDKEMQMENLDPVEEADTDIEVNCTDDLRMLCQTKIKMATTLALKCVPKRVPRRGDRSCHNLVPAELKNEEEQIVAIKFSNGQPKVKKSQVNCFFDSQCGYNRNVPLQLDQVEAGVYHIKYTPNVQQHQSLTITVNGQNIEGGLIQVAQAGMQSSGADSGGLFPPSSPFFSLPPPSLPGPALPSPYCSPSLYPFPPLSATPSSHQEAKWPPNHRIP